MRYRNVPPQFVSILEAWLATRITERVLDANTDECYAIIVYSSGDEARDALEFDWESPNSQHLSQPPNRPQRKRPGQRISPAAAFEMARFAIQEDHRQAA